MAKADPQLLARQALSRAVADPVPRPLHGTAAKPGIFTGTAQPAKAAARLALDANWFEPSGKFEGKGKTRKELYRITLAGVRDAIEQGESAELLRDMLAALDRKQQQLEGINREMSALRGLLQQQTGALQELLKKHRIPDVTAILATPNAPATSSPGAPGNGWLTEAVTYLRGYRDRNPYGNCPLPELYHSVAAPHKISIGQFHDGIRQLVAEQKVRLHPFTQAAFQLRDEQYALLAGQEIKYYVELLAAG